MRGILIAIVALVVVGGLAFGARYGLKIRAKKKRKTTYESALRSFTRDLNPGMKRKEVESYLQAKDVHFLQMCCVASELSKRHSLDNLTKIGEEGAPWYCSEHNVYIAFQFTDHEQPVKGWKADGSDTLKAITICHWLEGCL